MITAHEESRILIERNMTYRYFSSTAEWNALVSRNPGQFCVSVMRTALVVLQILFVSFASAEDYGKLPTFEDDGQWPNVSVVALIGDPTSWDGKEISSLGYVGYDHHGTMLFMSSEHCRGFNTSYGVKLFFDDVPELEAQLINRDCIEIVVYGTYTATVYQTPEPGVYIIREVPGYLDVRAGRF